jgi:hypothetical protein
MDAPLDLAGVNAIALSFSGGGLRAAAIAHGVLKALEETKTPTGDVPHPLAGPDRRGDRRRTQGHTRPPSAA